MAMYQGFEFEPEDFDGDGYVACTPKFATRAEVAKEIRSYGAIAALELAQGHIKIKEVN